MLPFQNVKLKWLTSTFLFMKCFHFCLGSTASSWSAGHAEQVAVLGSPPPSYNFLCNFTSACSTAVMWPSLKYWNTAAQRWRGFSAVVGSSRTLPSPGWERGPRWLAPGVDLSEPRCPSSPCSPPRRGGLSTPREQHKGSTCAWRQHSGHYNCHTVTVRSSNLSC